MPLARLVRFHLGDRRAILDLAADRDTVWIGALWVLSAGLARRYDQADLLAEPWQVVMPLLVSWVNATLFFGLLWLLLIRRSVHRPRPVDAYRTILGLFWMTAPLAWLYALPVERFLSPVEAMRANLWLLLIVATWRVLLYARVVAVLVKESFPVGLWITLLFGDVVALAMLALSPKPIIAVMGGIEHAPQDLLMLRVGETVAFWCLLSLPIWLIAGPLTARAARPEWQPRIEPTSRPNAARSGRYVLVGAALVFWLPILPFTQAEQRLAGSIDRLLAAGEIEAAVEAMSARDLDDFPQHFDPRPRLWSGQDQPSAWRVLDVVERNGAAPWVAELYEAKIEREASHSFLWGWFSPYWRDPETIDAVTRVFAARPELVDLGFYRTANEYLERDDIDPKLREALERLVAQVE